MAGTIPLSHASNAIVCVSIVESVVSQNKFIVTLLVGFSVAAMASQAVAQKGPSKRETAMEKCLQVAGQIVGETQQMARTAAYKACMTKAGYKP
jgi:hypothetical protein